MVNERETRSRGLCDSAVAAYLQQRRHPTDHTIVAAQHDSTHPDEAVQAILALALERPGSLAAPRPTFQLLTVGSVHENRRGLRPCATWPSRWGTDR